MAPKVGSAGLLLYPFQIRLELRGHAEQFDCVVIFGEDLVIPSRMDLSVAIATEIGDWSEIFLVVFTGARNEVMFGDFYVFSIAEFTCVLRG